MKCEYTNGVKYKEGLVYINEHYVQWESVHEWVLSTTIKIRLIVNILEESAH